MVIPRRNAIDEKMINCAVCNKGDFDNKVDLTCCGCMKAFHSACLPVAARTKANTSWFCQECVEKKSLRLPPSFPSGSISSPTNPPPLQTVVTQEQFKSLMDMNVQTQQTLKSLESKSQLQANKISTLERDNKAKEEDIANLRKSLEEQSKKPPPVDPNGNEEDSEDNGLAQQVQRLLESNRAILDRIENLQSNGGSGSSQEAFENVSIAMRRKEIPPLRTFSGDPREWTLFETTFNQSTLEGKYSERENADRLRRALNGRASELVMSKLMFNTEGSLIMAALKEAFGDPDKLMSLITDELLNASDIADEKSPKLVDFYVKLEAYVANVKAIGRESALNSGYVLQKLLYKLPFRYQSEWIQFKEAAQSVDLCVFKDFVHARQKYVQLEPQAVQTSSSSFRPVVSEKRGTSS
jgi:Protein of unknown function (DUF1759)